MPRVVYMTSGTINSIARAADILKSLSKGIDRISEISEKVQLSRSTVHRFLKSLELSKMVIQDPISRRYFLGPSTIALALQPLIAHENLVSCAHEAMINLRDLSRETVVLHIRIGIERLCLQELPSPENIRYAAGKGNVESIYTGSAGKILLSELEDEQIQFLLKHMRLKRVGPNTITNKTILLKELMKARELGYSTSFGERIAGSASISVPIKEYISPVAVSVLGPDNRFTLKKMERIIDEMRMQATHVSRKLMQIKITE